MFTKTGSTLPNPPQIEDPNLIDMGADPPSSSELFSGNVFELFDPLKQSNRPHSWPSQLNEAGTTVNTPPFVTPTTEISPSSAGVVLISSPTYPYPIKLRLKLTTFPEIKPFSHLVQQIRNEHQSKQVLFILYHHTCLILDISSTNNFMDPSHKYVQTFDHDKNE